MDFPLSYKCISNLIIVSGGINDQVEVNLYFDVINVIYLRVDYFSPADTEIQFHPVFIVMII